MTPLSLYSMVARDLSVNFDYEKINFVSLIEPSHRGGGVKFIGSKYQRGYGIAGIVRKLRYAIPSFIKSPIGKQIVETGIASISDIAQGTPPVNAIQKHGRQAVKNLIGLGKRKQTIRQANGSAKRSFFLPAP